MFVSVVIPVRDAAKYLPTCLDQLLQQDYPHEQMEVIIVEARSCDATVEVAKSHPLEKIARKVLICPESGRSHGLNMGIRAAAGGAICRLDARTRIPHDYISTCVRTLAETGAANVGGLQVPEGNTPAQIGIGLAMSHPFGVGNAQFRLAKSDCYVDTVYLGFFRRDIFDKVGWFDERPNVISEDSDLNQRICAAGEKIYLIARLRVGYEPRASLRDQFILYFRYGMARAGNTLKHRNITSWRQLAAPGLVFVAMALVLAAWWLPVARLVLLGLGAFYLAIDILVAFQLAWQARRPAVLPYLLAAFPCMHWSYGLGFWFVMLVPNRAKKETTS